MEELLAKLREAVPPKRTGAEKQRRNRAVPAWRTNATVEMKALKSAFRRHGAHTEAKQAELVDKIIHSFREIARHRDAALGVKEFVAQPRQLSVWLNADGWNDEFEASPSEYRRGDVQYHCYQEGCNGQDLVRYSDAHWACREHYLRTCPDVEQLRDKTRELLRETPRLPDESWRNWSLRVMATNEVGRAYLARIKARPE